MANNEPTILLVSDDSRFCSQVREGLSGRRENVRVSTVSTLDAAWRAVEDATPDVILLQDAAIGENDSAHETCAVVSIGARRTGDPALASDASRLQSAVESLAGYAPVVVLGPPERRKELTALLNAGAAEYVEQSEGVPAALGCVEKRLAASAELKLAAPDLLSRATEDFGELLRHELNNPLTGILGNAELLLAEIRRKNDGRLPQGGQHRVETIAALAVRLRETVRRLSQEWERHRSPATATVRHR